MAGFELLIKSYDVRDLLDDIASSDPPEYAEAAGELDALEPDALEPDALEQRVADG